MTTWSLSSGRTTRLRAGAGIVLALALLTSCRNLLRPDEAEPPAFEGETVTVTVDYTSPEAVLNTMMLAINARGRPGNGQTAYVSAFANTDVDGVPLSIMFDPDVLAERQTRGKYPPDPWTRSHEGQFYTHLFTIEPTDEYTMVWSTFPNAPADELDESDNVVTLHRQYKVTGANSDSEEGIALGRATLVFRQTSTSSSRWVIASWQDAIDPEAGPDPSDVGKRSFSRLRIDTFDR